MFNLCEEIVAFSLANSLLSFKLVLNGSSTLSANTLPLPGLLTKAAVIATAGPCAPWPPTKLLLSHTTASS